MGRIHPHCPRVSLTPHETQHLAICQSIFLFAQKISHSLPNIKWPLLQQLGHFLLSLDDEDRATYLFRFPLLPGTWLFRIECSQCDNWIYGPLYICRKGPPAVRCSDCFNRYSNSPRRWLHKSEHKIFKIFAVPAKGEEPIESTYEELDLLLQDIMNEYSAASTAKPDSKLWSKETVASGASVQKTTLESPKTRIVFGPTMIACAVLIGMFGILFGYFCF